MQDVAAKPAAMPSPHHAHYPTPITGDKAKPKTKAKVKKELTATERKVQNQKRQGRQIVEWARKVEVLTAAAEEEKNKRLVLLHAKASAQKAARVRPMLLTLPCADQSRFRAYDHQCYQGILLH
jgi:hypothetical protein